MKAKNLQETDECENHIKVTPSGKFNFDDDFRRFNSSPIGYVIPNRYCYCGRLRSMYGDKFTNFNLNSDDNLCKRNELTNDVLELNSNAVYVTKKSLMLNQFLELADTNVTKAKDNRNRFHPPTTIPANNCQFRDDRLAVVKGRENGNSRTVCLSSSIFSDRRLVSLFRSVALYWFFCLNTVLAKSDALKRKTFAFDYDNYALTSFNSNELKFKVSPVVLNCFGYVDNDFLAHVILDALYDDENVRNRSVLRFVDSSKHNMNLILMRKIWSQFIRSLYQFWPNSRNTNAITEFTVTSNTSDEIVLRQSSVLSYRNEIELEQSLSLTLPQTLRNRINWIQSVVLFYQLGFEYYFQMAIYENEQLRFLETFEKEPIRITENRQENGDDSSESDESNIDENMLTGYSSELNSSYSIISNTDSEKLSDEEELLVDELSESEEFVSEDERRSENNDEYENEPEKYGGGEKELSASDSEEQGCFFVPKGILEDEPTGPVYNIWKSPLLMEDFLKRNRVEQTPPVQEREESADSLPPPYLLFGPSVSRNYDITTANLNSVKDFSMFSVPYLPTSNQNIESQVTENSPEIKLYNMWESPTFIECLSVFKTLKVVNNDGPSTSSASSGYTNESDHAPSCSTRSQHRNLNRSTVFTNGGAFEYYNKTIFELRLTEIMFNKSPMADVEDDLFSSSDETDEEVAEINEKKEDEFEIAGIDKEIFFKPIQPAFKVVTDVPAIIVRSVSGSMYVQNKKYFAFKHELDRNRPTKFQPKFEARANEKACQTENIFRLSDIDFLFDEEMDVYYQVAIQRSLVQEVPNPVENAARYSYTLENVFSRLESSDINGVDTDSTLRAYTNVATSEYVDPGLAVGYSNTVPTDFGFLY